MAVIGAALLALLAGQGYASVYLSTLPHTGLDGTAYVAFWTVNVNILLLVSTWILEEKVRSRALIFVIKYYYFLVRSLRRGRCCCMPLTRCDLSRSTSCQCQWRAPYISILAWRARH
jgi:hypothetical protein